MNIEYYEGLDSVLNARFYRGDEAAYQATRGPLLGFLLVPAEAAREALGLHALDPRPAQGNEGQTIMVAARTWQSGVVD